MSGKAKRVTLISRCLKTTSADLLQSLEQSLQEDLDFIVGHYLGNRDISIFRLVGECGRRLRRAKEQKGDAD